MEINYSFNKKFQTEKKFFVYFLINQLSFKTMDLQSNVLVNQNSLISTNPNNLKMQVDFSEFPCIKINLKNLFFPKNTQKTILEEWCQNLEEQVFYWSKTNKPIPFPKVSYLPNRTIGAFSELVSQIVVPGSVVIIFNFFIYAFLCYFMLRGIIGEIQYDDNSPPNFLSFNQLKPTVVSLYQTNIDIIKAALLCALISGGWFFGVQQFLICLLVKFYSKCAKNAFICMMILGIMQGSIYFSPTNYWWLIFFVLITMVSNILFGFLSRKFPIFLVKNQL